ncbi:MAG: GNAT family N-acetyltransferase [archaeon]|nr:GNAT family N-acetyltransferase [archaeon]
MAIVKADGTHIDAVVGILETTVKEFTERKIDMWQKGYPNRTSIENDLKTGNAYVYISDGEVLGYFYINYGKEEFQSTLRGSWGDDNPTVIHRLMVATSARGKGIGNEMISFWENDAKEKGYTSLRTETDETNLPMRGLMKHCGLIELGFLTFDNSDKLAFEKLL